MSSFLSLAENRRKASVCPYVALVAAGLGFVCVGLLSAVIALSLHSESASSASAALKYVHVRKGVHERNVVKKRRDIDQQGPGYVQNDSCC